MKTTIVKTVIALGGAVASAAFAATSGVGGEGSGLLTWFLIGFGVMVIMLQAVPAMILFASLLKGLFADQHETSHLPKV
ncbi:MAG: hypothetical protein WBI04_08110 [Trichlorobacter sp.]|jgi:hypothetical protein